MLSHKETRVYNIHRLLWHTIDTSIPYVKNPECKLQLACSNVYLSKLHLNYLQSSDTKAASIKVGQSIVELKNVISNLVSIGSECKCEYCAMLVSELPPVCVCLKNCITSDGTCKTCDGECLCLKSAQPLHS